MSQPILLDTCAAIYIMEKAPMRQAAVDAIDEAYDCGAKVFVSPVTAWEAGMLASKGRFRSRYSAQRWWSLLIDQSQIALAELSAQVLLESSFLPGQIHRDPMDRIIAATAREYGFTVMTRDPRASGLWQTGLSQRGGMLIAAAATTANPVKFPAFSASSCRKTLQNRLSILRRAIGARREIRGRCSPCLSSRSACISRR